MFDIVDTWKNILNIIKEELSEIGFNTWIKPLTPISYNNDTLTVCAEIEFNKEIIESRYLSLIKNAACMVLKRDVDIVVSLENSDRAEDDSNETEYVQQSSVNASFLNPKYTFDTFVVGESNRFAHAASLAVSETPAQSYNPLFLYGGVGLGKTHLMHSIGNYITKKRPDLSIMYVSSEKFTNDFINAIRNNTNQVFRDKYRKVDILMVDDIQFLGGKEGTQEEFFHTFNYLYQSNRQIVLTSDRPPKDINTLSERLKTRFESGLICDVKPPDLETRIAILDRKIQKEGFNVPNEVVLHIANKIKSNIRELEGALNRLIAMSQLAKKDITKEIAEDVLKDFSSSAGSRNVTVEQILMEVGNYYSTDPLELKSKSRAKEIAYKRQIAMYIIRNLTDVPYSKIGDQLGGRDHTTVMYAIDKIKNDMEKSNDIRYEIEEIIKNIKGT